ncbi:MAG: 2-C-methyl-D-erythritol 4-phosphate cytidylyltransferase [Candidatus Omnitrophica bacterium]|nr:2-C-methyl-D-erythritol 4-phosphate cytidylyltransferase [Candidatus Omnitrophota bacterium]
MSTQAVIVAAGGGKRLQSNIPKPLISLHGKPLIVFSLECFDQSPLIKSIIVVTQPIFMEEMKTLVQKYGIQKEVRFVVGGETRKDSVYNGLEALDPATEYVVVHDAARPFLSREILEEALRLCYAGQSVVVAVPVKPTIKRVKGASLEIVETLDRSELWEAQTPQIFKKDVLIKAHRQAAAGVATDDAALVEKLGLPVRIFPGEYRNIKITTPEDVKIGEGLL